MHLRARSPGQRVQARLIEERPALRALANRLGKLLRDRVCLHRIRPSSSLCLATRDFRRARARWRCASRDQHGEQAVNAKYFRAALAEENIQIVRRVFDGFVRRDVEAVLEVMAPDVEFSAPATQALAEKHVSYEGHDGIRDYFEDVARVWAELEVFLHEYHEVGDDRILVVGRVRGRGTGAADRRRARAVGVEDRGREDRLGPRLHEPRGGRSVDRPRRAGLLPVS